jgi:hypothetical protein
MSTNGVLPRWSPSHRISANGNPLAMFNYKLCQLYATIQRVVNGTIPLQLRGHRLDSITAEGNPGTVYPLYVPAFEANHCPPIGLSLRALYPADFKSFILRRLGCIHYLLFANREYSSALRRSGSDDSPGSRLDGHGELLESRLRG